MRPGALENDSDWFSGDGDDFDGRRPCVDKRGSKASLGVLMGVSSAMKNC